jgi:starvation-inducible outer membrane lipoprotein
MTRRASIISLIAMLAACSPNPNGQGVADFGSVTGTVVDAQSQQPIGTFTVSMGGQSVSVSPSARGQFTISNVPVGTQTLTVYAIGYQTYTQDGVVIQKDQTTPLTPIGIVATSGL